MVGIDLHDTFGGRHCSRVHVLATPVTLTYVRQGEQQRLDVWKLLLCCVTGWKGCLGRLGLVWCGHSIRN